VQLNLNLQPLRPVEVIFLTEKLANSEDAQVVWGKSLVLYRYVLTKRMDLLTNLLKNEVIRQNKL
jgi:hypothetical protein